MGCFSWMFADKQNKKPLNIGYVGYLIYPDGRAEKTDGGYNGYGHFGKEDKIDAYEEVANWNREYLAANPDYEVPQHGAFRDEKTGELVFPGQKKVSDFKWWPYYSDLSLSPRDVEERVRADIRSEHPELKMIFWDYRSIGIDICCYEDQSAKLPYPIKIASRANVFYDRLPPSKGDPDQGFGKNYWR